MIRKTTQILLLLFPFLVAHSTEPEREYDYIYFENSTLPEYYFYSSVSYSGNSYIKNVRGRLPICETEAFTPPNSLELAFSNGDFAWEAGIMYEPVRGNDFFKDADYLSFYIYSDNTRDDLLPDVRLNLLNKNRRTGEVISDVSSKKLPIQQYLTETEQKEWKQVKIPLSDFGAFEGRPNNIIFSGAQVKGEGKILIDQLELYADKTQSELPIPKVIRATGYEQHVDLTWNHFSEESVKYIKIYRSEDNMNFEAVGIQNPWFDRYTDYVAQPGKTFYYKISLLDRQYRETEKSSTVQATTRHFSDDELLDMVQEASFRYYWEGAEPNSGLARENIPGRKNMIATGASGFGIMATIVGAERGFIKREEAVQRMLKVTSFLQKCDRYHGAFSHFIDGPTGKTEPFFGERDNGGDLVETSFLFQGLLAAREYFDLDNPEENQIRASITQLWETVEWDWYDREKENKFLTWHWSPDKEWIIDHKLIGWNETMITYILAISSPGHAIPATMYYNGWASRDERAINYRKAWGKTDDGSSYVNGNYYYGIQLPVGVSNGGPLFFIHYSYMGFDPHRFTDRYTNYFENNKRIALINWRYCTENPKNHRGMGEDFWGLTASDGPWGYDAIEPNIRKDNGTLAPTGALASFPYTPEQSMAALKNMYRNYGKYLWGEYGFKDAVNLDENWIAKIFMGLNQAPVTVMIENYRSGLIWNLFMNDSDIQEGLEKLRSLKSQD